MAWVFWACHLFPLTRWDTIVHGYPVPPALLETALVWARPVLPSRDVVWPTVTPIHVLLDHESWHPTNLVCVTGVQECPTQHWVSNTLLGTGFPTKHKVMSHGHANAIKRDQG